MRPKTANEEMEVVQRRWIVPPSSVATKVFHGDGSSGDEDEDDMKFSSTSSLVQIDTEWNLIPFDWWTTWCRYSGFSEDKIDKTTAARPRTRSKQNEADSVAVLSSFLTEQNNNNNNKNKTNEEEKETKVIEPPLMLRQSSKGEAPPPLSFAPLLSSNGRLKINLKYNEDYVVVTPRVWKVLQDWYGGETQRGIRRRVVRLGQNAVLEIYPPRLRLYINNRFGRIVESRTSSLTISASSTLNDVLRESCRLLYRNPDDFCIYFEEVGLLDEDAKKKAYLSSVKWRTLEIHKNKDLTQSLFDLGIDNDHRIFLQSKKRDSSISSKDNEEKEKNEKIKLLRPGIRGLANLGNTCYMNASLQCLSNTRLLREYCVSEDWMYDLCDSNAAHRMGMAGKLAVVFCRTIERLWDEKSSATHVIPKTMKTYLGKFKDTFKDNDQQDAHELLSQLLSGLHEDTNRIHDKPGIEPTDSEKRPDSIVATEWRQDELRRNMSIVTSLFTGQFKTCKTCSVCDKESSRFDPFTFIQVPLPDPPFRYVSMLIHFDKNIRAPLKVSLRVSREGTLDDVLEALEKLKISCTGKKDDDNFVLAKDCRVANISQHFIMTFVSSNQSLTRIGRGTLCVYHLPVKGCVVVEGEKDDEKEKKKDASDYLNALVVRKNVEVICPRNARENGQLSVKAPDGTSHIVNIPEGVLPGTHFKVVLTCARPVEAKEVEVKKDEEEKDEEEKKKDEEESLREDTLNRNDKTTLKGEIHTTLTERKASPSTPMERLEKAYISAAIMFDKTNPIDAKDKIDVNLGGVMTLNRAQMYADKWFRGEIVNINGDGTYDVKLCNRENVYKGSVRGENRSGLARLRRHVPKPQTILCVHRRLVFQTHYFLTPWRLRTFGCALAVRAYLESVNVLKFYEIVWQSVKRYVPDWDPSLHAQMISKQQEEGKNDAELDDMEYLDESPDPNIPPHPSTMNRFCYRQDGIHPYDGKAYEEILAKYPFRLSLVKKDGSACCVCNVLQACTGCLLPPLKDVIMDDVVSGEQASVSIDWSPIAIREFYNQKRASLIETHDSVEENMKSQKKPYLLTNCMREFTKVNEITAYCSTCTKKNDGDFTETKHTQSDEVWAVPPYLIVQIKRFKNYGRYSYKLGNLVQFPLKDFDIHPFIAKEMHALKGDDLEKMKKKSELETLSRCRERLRKARDRVLKKQAKMKPSEIEKSEEEWKKVEKEREITEDMLKSLPKSLARGEKNTIYDLYAVCHHTGALGGGHYFAHAVDADGKWWRFDDKKVSPLKDMKNLISQTAYILFYARRDVRGLKLSDIYPRYFETPRDPKDILSLKWKKPKNRSSDGDEEKGMLKNCSVM